MIDLTGVTHHPAIEEIVEVLCNKTKNTDRVFFRTEMAYFLGKMAGTMRATIVTKDRGDIPVNVYAVALATSGYGKGHSVHIVENEICKGFKKRFMEDTLPVKAEEHLWVLANERAVRLGTDPGVEFEGLNNEYKRAGAYPFTFDSGTSPAVKQLRHKLLLAYAGSINLQIDEIGSNLIGQVDVLNLFLELYDQGIVKQKLIKNTADNQRGDDLDGKTPTNMLLFGTPAKLFDGSQTEEQFYSFLDIGFARRCLFSMGQQDRKSLYTETPAEIYARSIKPGDNSMIKKWSTHFHKLADPAMFGWRMELPDDVAIQLLTYQIACEQQAETFADHEEIKKAEMSHRYFKALKVAGALAYCDESSEVEMGHLMSAILLVEESGISFNKILNREPTHVKLARYMATCKNEVTHADLMEALPFFKKGNAARNEMMTLATAWGYKHHIIIKKTFTDGIEFITGETLEETDIDKLHLSFSEGFAYNYAPDTGKFEDMQNLAQAEQDDGSPFHWTNHQFKNGHRSEENVIPGFNMIVIDVDGGTPVSSARELMGDIKHAIYTTKRHTEEENRFRMILPINYFLELTADEYKEFMNGVMEWLPFKSDPGANQRARKWETYSKGEFFINTEGNLFDALPFIPKTSKNEQWRQGFQKIESFDNLERWFATQMVPGQRNDQMIKYALILVDNGMDLMAVGRQVHAFNKKLSNPLPEDEIESTIMATVSKRVTKKPR